MISIVDKSRQLRQFLAYDMEWIPGSLEIRLVGIYDGNEYRCYRTVRDFFNRELTHKNRGKWFFAHAGGLADVQFILDYAVQRGNEYRVNAHFSGSSAIIVHITQGKNAWHFIDSYWLLRDKLANIGEWIGFSKGKTGDKDETEEGLSDKEYQARMDAKREWYATVAFNELRDYNEKDCFILWTAIDEFENILLDLGGQLQMTLASSAMYLFRRKYLSANIATSGKINDVSRKSYFASRVEVLQSSIEDAFYYDVNSSFPFAMTFPCPGEYIGSFSTIPDNDYSLYIADCLISIPDMALPPTPIRLKSRVFFPTGQWRAWLTNADINLILREGGHILKVYEAMVFDPFYDLAAYAGDLYAKRKAAKTPFEKVAYKLLLNSLYGKFAESQEKTSLVLNPNEIPYSAEEQQKMRMVQLFPGAWLRDSTVPVPHVHVPISSHITSIARRTLYDYMQLCRDYHYCDTDGFSTTENLISGQELGEIKLEKRIKEGQFVSSKLYKIDGQVMKDGQWVNKQYVKGKGFSRLTAERFAKLLEGEAIEFERMARIRERFRAGFSNPKENKYLKRINLVNVLDPRFNPSKHVISKRFHYPDGTTRPWDLTELQTLLGG